MKVDFVPASTLKQRYHTRGKFYSLPLDGAGRLKCRSTLEIRAVGLPDSAVADAVFVMMNPGSSEPLPDAAGPACDELDAQHARMVPARPDTTQYQVMRVMDALGWDLVRVINLSDLRDPNSGSFAGTLADLHQLGMDGHSIFSSQRRGELNDLLARKPGAPLVRAWGVSDDLNPLVELAMAALATEKSRAGIEKLGQPGKFYHPLPTRHALKLRWLEDIGTQLRGDLAQSDGAQG